MSFNTFNTFNKSLLELTIRGKDFIVKHVTKTSPQCIVYLRTTGANSESSVGHNNRFLETGRTEVIRNSRNPEWSIKVPIVYKFNEWQTIKLEVWDYDICADNELLGELEMDLSTLVVNKSQPIVKRLKLYSTDKSFAQFSVTGELSLTIDEVRDQLICITSFANHSFPPPAPPPPPQQVLASKQTVRMQFEAKGLPQKDFLGSSDPYLTLTKENFDGTDTQVYRTETIYKTLEPIWSEFTLRVDDLCDCDHHKLIRISCFDWDRHSSDDFIGAVNTSLHELNRHISGLKTFELRKDDTIPLNTKAKSKSVDNRSVKRKSFLMKNFDKKFDQNYGSLLLRKLNFRQVPTFVDYVRAGATQIHLMAAIDCTTDSQPFHRRLTEISGQQINCFEHIVQSLGQILRHYDYQGLYAGFGFGARLQSVSGERAAANDWFNFKHNSIVPYCDSFEDMIRSYKSSLTHMEWSTHRHFAPVITEVLQLTKNFLNGKHYFVFVVITTGSNADNADTLEAIVKASAMPLSIIIVGVGNSGFSNLKRLSGDSTCSRGTRTYRDNVQFFQLKNYLSDDRTDDRLVRDLLEGIPQQMLEFMESRNYLP